MDHTTILYASHTETFHKGEYMDKNTALDRLVFCGECVYWHSLNDKRLKKEYRDYIGVCNRPWEDRLQRDKDDFCSRGSKIVIMDTKRED